MATLSPFDLLLLSEYEQTVFRTLTKKPKQTINEIAFRTGLSPDEVDSAISTLLARGSLIEQLQEGKRVLSVRLEFKRKTVRNMPSSILDLYEKATHSFLYEVPLTQCLSEQEVEELLQISDKKILFPDEVLSWQGEKLDFVAVVERGLVVQTRLKGQHLSEKVGYTRRTEWIGISSVLSNAATSETCTAVTETSLLIWPKVDFIEFLNRHNSLMMAIGHQLSQMLESCKSSKTNGLGKLWVIEGASSSVGVTTFAENLALLAYESGQNSGAASTLLWQRASDTFNGDNGRKIKDLAFIHRHPAGFDQMSVQENHEYPSQVQLDILLGELLSTYENVICDTGCDDTDELYLRLRGQGQSLLMITDDPYGLEKMFSRWQKSQPYAIPNQKRLLALNNTAHKLTEIDPRFNMVIPKDDTAICHTRDFDGAVLKSDPKSIYGNAIEEIYRRLSLNHALAIFVPSTLDINQPIDNENQVQSTLQFFGNMFGGATKSDAEGVWRSEDSGLVTEQVTIVRTFVSKNALDTHLDSVVEFATQLKKEMKQEAVALSVDHQLILV